MSVDTSGHRAARALLQATERLGPPPDLDRLRRRRRRRSTGRVGLAFAAVLVTGALAGQALTGLERIVPDRPPQAAAPATTLALPGVTGLDPHVRDAVVTGKAVRADVAAGPGAVWVLNRSRTGSATLVRVDPANDEVVARVDPGLAVSQLAVGEDGAVWLYRTGRTLDKPELVRVEPGSNRVADVIPLPRGTVPAGANDLLVAGGAVWLADQDNRLLRVDPASREVREVEGGRLAQGVEHLAFAGGWVWATKGPVMHRIQLDGSLNLTYTNPDLEQATSVLGLVGGAGGLWVLGVGPVGEHLFQVDPATVQLLDMAELSHRTEGRWGAAAAGDRVVAARSGPSLFLADPADGTLRATVPVPQGQGGVAVGSGAIWVADPANGRLLRVDPGF